MPVEMVKRFLLLPDRATSPNRDPVRCRHKQASGELGLAGLGKEGRQPVTFDSVVWAVALRLDGPQFAGVGFGDEVDAVVVAVTARPVAPQPNSFEDQPVLRMVLQHPFHNRFERFAVLVVVREMSAKLALKRLKSVTHSLASISTTGWRGTLTSQVGLVPRRGEPSSVKGRRRAPHGVQRWLVGAQRGS